jgi:hypothetical protein
MQIIRDLGEFYRKEDSSALNWVKDLSGDANFESKSIIEGEIKKIFELFDKKKTIVIPKVEESEKLAAAQSTSEGKFTTHSVSYKQSEFKRPNNYIVYSEKNRLEPKGKDYEASVIDLNFLKFENNFISSEELEKIISALENDINKGEMIPNERVKEIILSIIPPDKKQHVDKIIRVSKLINILLLCLSHKFLFFIFALKLIIIFNFNCNQVSNILNTSDTFS